MNLYLLDSYEKPLSARILGVGSIGLDAVRMAMRYPPLRTVVMNYGHVGCGPDGPTPCIVTRLADATEGGEACILEEWEFWENADLAMIVFGHDEPGAMAQALSAAMESSDAGVFTLVVCALAGTAKDDGAFQLLAEAFNPLGIAPILAVMEAGAFARPSTRFDLPMPVRALEAVPRIIADPGLVCIDLVDVHCTMDRWSGVTLMGTGESASHEPSELREAVRQALRQAGELGLDAAASGLLVDAVVGPSGSIGILYEIGEVVGPKMTGPQPVVIGLDIAMHDGVDRHDGMQVTVFLCGVAVGAGQGTQALDQDLGKSGREPALVSVDLDSDLDLEYMHIPKFLIRKP